MQDESVSIQYVCFASHFFPFALIAQCVSLKCDETCRRDSLAVTLSVNRKGVKRGRLISCDSSPLSVQAP
jgi:hypothetical protein